LANVKRVGVITLLIDFLQFCTMSTTNQFSVIIPERQKDSTTYVDFVTLTSDLKMITPAATVF